MAFFAPLIAFAQGTSNFVPLANYDGSQPLKSAFESSSLSSYFSAMFKISLSVGAILAVMMLVYGGYLYMGSDMWATKQRAKQVITDAIIGLLLLVFVYLILFQINPCILQMNIFQLGESTKNGQCS